MTTVIKPRKIYPSSSGFALGQGVVTDYESGCLRYMLVAPYAPFPTLDPLFGEIGLHHENWYAEQLGTSIKEREFSMKSVPLPGVEFSGRCDFITEDGVIHETKASFSKNFLYSVINQGQFKNSHLAQLVAYLIELKTTKGKIVCGYYEVAPDGTYSQQGLRSFDVEVVDGGFIMVDGKYSGFTVGDQLAHRMLAAKVLSEQLVHSRPVNHEGFTSPCNYCPMSSVCDKYDQGVLNKDDFIKAGVITIKDKKQLKAKPLPLSKRRSKGK